MTPSSQARHLAWLLRGWPLDRGMFYGEEAALAGVDLDRVADEGARVFLAAYKA